MMMKVRLRINPQMKMNTDMKLQDIVETGVNIYN
jgi:hypothetical protein